MPRRQREIDQLVAKGASWEYAERRVLSFGHADLSAYFAERSGLSPAVCEAIQSHHDDLDRRSEHRDLTAVLQTANYLVTRAGTGLIEGRTLPPPSDATVAMMGLGQRRFDEIWVRLPSVIEDSSELAKAV